MCRNGNSVSPIILLFSHASTRMTMGIDPIPMRKVPAFDSCRDELTRSIT